ncbi:MAG: hypothetical protein KAS63_07140 [Candidatus Heimdallarchaeota archaeon]|nr:hypothetical protein [Candidatus Heimdallarchaeota archaeon]MCK4955121.1 hypothetical protein [Candidatus Heimdallarchaeota archaeon]
MSEQPTGPPAGPPRGPMFMRDEYQNLIDEFTKDVKDQLKDEVKSLLLIGSVVSKEHIAGESDCDFLIILKDKASGDKLKKSMEKISQLVHKYLEDPLYGSLLDVEVLSENDIPKKGESSDYSWTRTLVAQRGKALIGDNLFAKVEVKDEDAKESAKEMAESFLAQMEELTQQKDIDEYDKLYLTAEAVLGCACAYLFFNGEREFYKSSAVILFEDKYRDKIRIDSVQTSHRLRLAAKSVNTKNFEERALKFCKEVIKEISK